MTDFPFDLQLVVDPFNTSNVVANGQVFIYDPSDTDNSNPLVLKDPHGLPLTNPLMSNSNGFLQAFLAPSPQVKWASGGFVGYFNSYQGLLNEVILAREAAELAARSGIIPPGGTVGQVLTKTSNTDGFAGWRSPIVIIGPSDAWPTGLPEGTLVVRTEA